MENYRLEGLKREADEIAQKLKEGGLMGCDLEVIGALLFTKYKGEDKRISEMLDNTSKVIKEAEELLERLSKQEN
jgi:hypothetical protein